ncbi:unnamed protein product [Closterium sp. NIES-54]
MRLLLVLIAVLLTGSVDSLWNNRPASVAQAVTYVVGGTKGWPAVATWKKPEFFARDVLVFKWKPRRTRKAILGQKHNLALVGSVEDFNACNVKKVQRVLVKSRRKAKFSFILDFSSTYYLISTKGKDCKNGMKITITS